MQKTQQSAQSFVRNKLYSLRSLAQQTSLSLQQSSQLHLQKLERALQRDSQHEHSVAEPISPLPDSEEAPPEGRLWRYFLGRMAAVTEKVEKERVNCCEKCFQSIRKEVAARLQSHARNASSLSGVVRQKYRQIHQLFEEIRQLKAPSLFADSPRSKRPRNDLLSQSSESAAQRREYIAQLRGEVEVLETQAEKMRGEHDKVQREWRTLLQNMLHQGYYLRDGVSQILAEMGRIGYKPQPADFPPFLDETSRACLLQEHSRLTTLVPPDQPRSRISSETGSNLSQLAKKVHLRQVYSDTKQFISNWVRQSAWKGSTLPPLRSPPPPEPQNDWREGERKRLSHAYEGEAAIRARQVLFGWKLQIPL